MFENKIIATTHYQLGILINNRHMFPLHSIPYIMKRLSSFRDKGIYLISL